MRSWRLVVLALFAAGSIPAFADDPADEVIRELIAAKAESDRKNPPADPAPPVVPKDLPPKADAPAKKTDPKYDLPRPDPTNLKDVEEFLKRTTDKIQRGEIDKHPASETGKVIDEIIEEDDDRQIRDLIKADALYREAIAMEKAGKVNHALVLGKRALKLAPKNKEIREFVSRLEKLVRAQVQQISPQIRAKAYLSAAVAHAQRLLRQQEYAAGKDLLEGVIESAALLPKSAGADFYAQIAQKELAALDAAVKEGKIELKSATQKPQVVLVVPDKKTGVPDWYIQAKRALEVPMNIDYRRMPLGLILDDVAAATKLEIIIDRPLQMARVQYSTNLDITVRKENAERVLNEVCQKAGVDFVLMEKGVVITTREKVAEYHRNLANSLGSNWSTARTLFPEISTQRLATQPSERIKVVEVPSSVPDYLRSGAALVSHIRKMIP